MAITINGSGTITGISAGGLPDGSVTAADIESSLDLSGKTVTLPSGTGGKVLQVVSTVTNTGASTTAVQTWADAGLSATITPSSTSSKVLVLVSQSLTLDSNTNGQQQANLGIFDSSNNLLFGYMNWDQMRVKEQIAFSWAYPITYLHSPNTTSAFTYKTRMSIQLATGSLALNAQASSSYSSMVLMEIAG